MGNQEDRDGHHAASKPPGRSGAGAAGIAGIWATIMTAISSGNVPPVASGAAVVIAAVVTAVYVLRGGR